MARVRASFVCQACGAVHARWAGRCDSCAAWNSISEEPRSVPKAASGGRAGRRVGRGIDLVSLQGEGEAPRRIGTSIAELDRVLGGGLVPGSALLVGGDPGIGKSTLTLQAAAALADAGRSVTYVSGEESVEQIRMRAGRLGLSGAALGLAAATAVGDILTTLDGPGAPDLLVVDSIQTMWVEEVEAAPGTVGQLRAAAQALIGFAKRRGTAVVLIGHVTKDGQIAGPRVLEHMVDAVLYFEGERGQAYRILRAVKNRFGPGGEIGVFEMRERGLVPVANPSALFLTARTEAVAGTAVFAGLEGTRPVLVEIQALVAPSPLGSPRRAVVGWDANRLAMVLAVLETRCGLVVGPCDIYLNVAGGLKVGEPAADLAVAAALVSSLFDVPLPREAVLFGEIGLAGEVRQVAQAGARLKEASKLGFTQALIPPAGDLDRPGGIEVVELRRLLDLVERLDRCARTGSRPPRRAAHRIVASPGAMGVE